MRWLLPATALAGLLAAVLVAGAEWGLLLQFLLGKLAYSTSNGAALYLLGFLTLAAWCWRFSIGNGVFAFRVFLVCLGLGHALNLWLTLRYLDEMGVPLAAHVYHWQASGYSFTGLFHSHLGKTAFAIAARQFGWQPSGYDGGGVFLDWVPAAAAWGIGLAFLIGSSAALLATPTMMRGRHRSRGLLLLLACAIALRGMIDGGPLAPGIFPAFVVLAACCLPLSTAWRWVAGSLLAVVLLGYLALWLGIAAGDEIPALGSLLFPVLFFLWLGLCGAERPRLGLRVGLIGLLTLVVGLDATGSLLPLLSPASAACESHSLNRPAEQFGRPCSGRAAYRVYREHGEDPRKPQATLIDDAGMAGSHRLQASLLILSADKDRLALAPGATWQTLQIAPYSLGGGWLVVQATADPRLPVVLASGDASALSRNNYNVYLWELARDLQRGGAREFILLPATRGNGLARDG